MVEEFLNLFLEVEAGCRPRRQLSPLMTPMLYARLTDVWVRGGTPGRVVSVTVLAHAPLYCDLVAVVRRGDRCGGLSVRLLRVPGQRWLVDVVARPEDGQLPGPAYPVPTDDVEDEAVALPAVEARPGAPMGDWLVQQSGG